MAALRLVALAGLLAAVVSCGSSSTNTTSTCAPGATQACLGPGACGGAQSCKDDGSGWNACDCGGKVDSGTPVDATTDAPLDTPPDSTPEDTATPPDTPADTGPVVPLSPDKLAGLGLWLDTDKGVILTPDNAHAIKWIDQSPIANNTKFLCGGSCGGCSLVCGLKRLIADTKGGGHDGYQIGSTGKIDCCTYDGTTILVDDDPSIQFGKGPFAFFIVAKALNVTSQRDLWAKRSGATNGLSIVYSTTKFEVKTETATAKLTFTSSSSAYRLLVVRGPVLKLRADGAAVEGTAATDDLSAVGTSPNIGTLVSPGTTAEEFAIAEYVVVKGAVSDAQVLGVEAYLKTKYKMSF